MSGAMIARKHLIPFTTGTEYIVLLEMGPELNKMADNVSISRT